MSKYQDLLVEQLDLLELNLRVVALLVREAQERWYFKPCRLKRLSGCLFCKAKQHFLKERFH